MLFCFFFVFRVAFNNFFTIPADIENARLKLALAPAGAPITVVTDALEILPPIIDKTIKGLSK